jgi:hypothetical protein
MAEKNHISITRMMDILSDLFPVHSLFGMVDSIGLGLLTSGKTEYNVARIKSVLDAGREKMNFWMNEGCPAATGCFLEFIAGYEGSSDEEQIDEDSVRRGLLAVLINEAALASSDNGKELIDVLSDVLGLSDGFRDIYEKYGYDAVCSALDEAERLTGTKISLRADEELYKKIM